MFFSKKNKTGVYATSAAQKAPMTKKKKRIIIVSLSAAFAVALAGGLVYYFMTRAAGPGLTLGSTSYNQNFDQITFTVNINRVPGTTYYERSCEREAVGADVPCSGFPYNPAYTALDAGATSITKTVSKTSTADYIHIEVTSGDPSLSPGTTGAVDAGNTSYINLSWNWPSNLTIVVNGGGTLKTTGGVGLTNDGVDSATGDMSGHVFFNNGVNFEASPNPGNYFTGWAGYNCGTSAKYNNDKVACTINNVEQDRTLTANFAPVSATKVGPLIPEPASGTTAQSFIDYKFRINDTFPNQDDIIVKSGSSLDCNNGTGTLFEGASGGAGYLDQDTSDPDDWLTFTHRTFSNLTISLIACQLGYSASDVVTASYTISDPPPPADTVATPTFSPASGSVQPGTVVTISTATTGATIYYTTDGTTPTTSSTQGSSVTVSEAMTIKALATKSGMENSAVGSASYTITSSPGTVALPTFSPASGTYSSAQSVSISTATSGATIKYTVNGDDPATDCSDGTTYSSPVSVSTTTTIKARACKSEMTASDVAAAAYTISTPGANEVALPTFSPASGTYSSAQSVSISTATSGATIKYTVNGDDPATDCSDGTTYSSPVSVSTTTTIKARACKSEMTASDVAAAAYTISDQSGDGGVDDGGTGSGNSNSTNQQSNSNLSDSGPVLGSTAINLLVALLLALGFSTLAVRLKNRKSR